MSSLFFLVLNFSVDRYELELVFAEIGISLDYAQKFVFEEISVDDLSFLSEAELERLIPTLGARIKLRNYILKLQSQHKPVEESPVHAKTFDVSEDHLVDLTQMRIRLKRAEEIISELQRQNDELKAENAAVRQAAERGSLETPSEFVCPISGACMTDPVVAGDGIVYDRSSIASWLKSSHRSPLNGEMLPAPVDELVPYVDLKKRIDAFLEKQCKLSG